MSNNFILVKGDKGLYYSDGNKIYFPDRRWIDAKEGFATDMEITIDKGSYAFIRGVMLETQPINTDEFVKLHKDDLKSESSYYLGKIGDSDYLVELTNYDITVYIKCNNDYNILFNQSIVSLNKSDRYFYDFLKSILVFSSGYIDFLEYFVKYTDFYNFDDDKVLAYCTRVVASHYFGHFGHLESVTVYDNKVIQLTSSVNNLSSYYVYDRNDDSFNQISSNIFCNLLDSFKSSKKFSKKDINDYAVKNHISFYDSMHKGKFVERTIAVFNTMISVISFNGVTYNPDKISDEDKKVVEDSWKNLEDFKFNIGKSCGIKGLTELKKLSPLKILVGR